MRFWIHRFVVGCLALNASITNSQGFHYYGSKSIYRLHDREG